MVGNDTFEPTD